MEILSVLKDIDRTQAERFCEQRSRAVAVGDGRLLCRVLGQYMMYVPAEDTSLTPHLALNGYWEMWITQCLAREIKPGMGCVDVGANVGYFTCVLADAVGDGDGWVYAFEPQATLAAMLVDTMKVNGWTSRVHVASLALSDRQGTGHLMVPGRDMGSASLGSGGSLVQLRQLDDLVQPLGPVHFMKLDVEGHEDRVLAGAQKVLRDSRPTLLIEWCKAMAGPEPFRHIEPLLAAGYSLGEVGTDSRIDPVTTEELARKGDAELAMLWMAPKV